MKQAVIFKVLLTSIESIFITHLAQGGTAVINCPDISFLDDSARITCSTSVNFTTVIYTCPCGPATQCFPSECTNVSGYNASIVSGTQAELTILSAEPRHTGNWSCSDAGRDEGKSVCNLVITKIPSVTITSDVDDDSVNLDDRISLTVDIGGYYCSGAYSLTLQVGSVNYTLGSGRNNTNRNLTETIPINVTQTHLGDVKIVFACDNHRWNITPEGVHQLQPNITNVPTTTGRGDVTSRCTETPITTLVQYVVPTGTCLIILLLIIITCCCCYRHRNAELHQTTHLDPPYIYVPGPANTAYFEINANFQLNGSNPATNRPEASQRLDVTSADPEGDATGINGGSVSAAEENTQEGVIVTQLVPDVDGLYASVNKTTDISVRNFDTAL